MKGLSTPIIILIVSAIFLVLVITGLFIFRSGQKSELNISPTPQETLTPFNNPAQTNTPTPSPTPSKSPTPSPKPTPSKTPSPTPSPTSISIILNSNGSLDGFESSNGGGNLTIDVRAGRNSNLTTRGFLSFDVATLNGKTIDKATVRIYQKQVIGSPYSNLGSLKIDHLDYGNSLENTDYGISSLSTSFATITTNPSIEWKDVDVTDMLRDDLTNSRQRSQYRIHFQTESTGGDITGDFAYFESQDNSMGSGNTPQLVVKYH